MAFICTEIPPRAIGCFEMDVNMKLFAIYLRPFGCLYSVTSLQGHRRVLKCAIMEGCLSHHGLSECEKESERQHDKERFHNTTRFVDIAQLSEMQTLSKAEKTQNKCGFINDFLSVLVRSHSRTDISPNFVLAYTTLRCGMVPCYC